VRNRADPADTAGELGHVFGLPALAELLEPAQLRDLQVGVLDLALVVEENLNLPVPLQPRDRVNRDPLAHFCLRLLMVALARPYM